MKSLPTYLLLVTSLVMVALVNQGAWAVPTQVTYEDALNCDPLFVPRDVHELGIAPAFSNFPDELISAVSTFTPDAACPLSDNPQEINRVVQITNLTGIDWGQVWYVADPGAAAPWTTISNFDGHVDMLGGQLAGQAFKIDTVGMNKPLIFESIASNGIFEAGEVWQFIIDDYANTGGLLPEAFDSIGVASASLSGPPSSGSIIATEAVPEPSSIVLLLLGAVVGIIYVKIGRDR